MLRTIYRKSLSIGGLIGLNTEKINNFYYKMYTILFKKPLFLQIELNNICNLKCKMCALNKMKRTPQIMDFELYKKVIDDAGKMKIKVVKLFLFNEPLLYPRLEEAIDYAKDKGIDHVVIVTNANLLSEEKAASLLKTKLDKITYSIEGTTKEEYESVRIGGNFDLVYNNIFHFKKMRDDLNKKKPVISIQSIIDIKGCCNDPKKFKSFWRNLADEIDFIKVGVNEDNFHLKNAKGRLKQRTSCIVPWTNLAIFPEGRVSLCCDPENTLKLGEINNNHLWEIWNSNKLKNLRKIIKEGRVDAIPICASCKEWEYGNQ